jgi:hypothetical protein
MIGVGGSVASQPSETEKIPNDPAGGAGSSPFKSPQAWAPWTQQQPDPRMLMAPATGMGGNDPRRPVARPAGPGPSNHTSPLAQTLLDGPGGLPANPAQYGPQTQAAIAGNDKFVQQYQGQQQAGRNSLLEALQNVAGMATYTNPFSGYSSQGNVTGG